MSQHAVKKLVISGSLAALFIGLLPAISFADSGTWDGNGAALSDGLWLDITNWGGIANIPTTFDTATFNNAGGGFTTIDLGTGVQIQNIIFDTSSAAPYTIGTSGSQTLNLSDGGSITVNSSVIANETFGGLVTLGTASASTYSFNNNSTTNTLIFAGGVQGGATGTAGAKTLTLSGNTRISGNVSNGGSSSLALTTSGAGTLTLSGTNSQTGATTVATGTTLAVLGSAAMSSGSQLILQTDSTLQLRADANSTFTTSQFSPAGSNTTENFDVNQITGAGTNNVLTLASTNAFTVGGNGTMTFNVTGGNGDSLKIAGNANFSANNTNSWILNPTTANLTIAGNVAGSAGNTGQTLNLGGTSAGNIVSGIISNPLGLTKSTTSTWTLTAANTFTGTTAVSLGTLDLQNALALQNSPLAYTGGTVAFDSVAGTAFTVGGLTGGTSTLVMQNTAAAPITLTLNPSGNVTFGGILDTGSAASLIKTGAGTQIITNAAGYTGGTTVNVGGLTFNSTLASTSLTLGGGTITFGAAASSANFSGGTTLNPGASALVASSVTGTVALGTITRHVGSAINITLPTVTGTVTTPTANTAGTILGGWATVNGANWAVSAGNGSTPGAITALASGVANTFGSGIDTDASGSVAGGSTNSLRFNSAAATTVSLASPSVIASGGILETAPVANNLATITGSTLQGPSGGDLILNQFNTSNSLLISSSIIDNGGTNLVKAGTGTVMLSSNNTYAGSTYIGTGTLQIGAGGSTGSINMAAIINNGTLSFDRTGSLSVTKQINGIGATSINGGFTLTTDYTAGTAPSSNLLSTGSLIMGGGTLNVIGSSSIASSQTFAGFTSNVGTNVITAAPVSGANLPTVALGAITNNVGGAVEFIGSSTSTGVTSATGQTGANGNGTPTGQVLATASITTTSTTTSGTLFSAATSAYGSVGLYDFAGLSNGTIVGLSQASGGSAGDGGYNISNGSLSSTLVNDVLANVTVGGTRTVVPGLRFNSPAALTITGNSTTGYFLGGALVTPNVGAFNTTLATTNTADFLIFGTNTGTGTTVDSGTIWQNNTQGFLRVTATLGNGRGSGGSTIVQAGPGTVVYSGNATNPNFGFSGLVYLNGGVSEISTDGCLGAAGTAALVTLNGGTILGTANFVLDNGGANPRPVALSSIGGGLGATTGFQMTVDGVISGAVGAGPLVIGIPASSANGNVNGQVPGTGAGTANTTAVNAAGTVILSNTANTYTGGTVLDSGVLQFGGNLGVLGTGGITLNGGIFQWSGNTTDITARTVAFASTGTLDTQANNVILASSIGGAGGFTKFGTGTLTLNGANSFTGGITLSQGALILDNSNVNSGPTSINAGTLTLNTSFASLGNTAITVANAATLAANASTGNINIGTIGASLNLNTGGKLTLANNLIDTLTLNPTGGSGTGPVLTLGAATLTLDLGSGGADELIAKNGTLVFSGGTPIISLASFGSTAPSVLTNIPLISVPNATGNLLSSGFSLSNTLVNFGANQYSAALANNGPGTMLLLNLTLNNTSLDYYFTGISSSSWSNSGNFNSAHTGGGVESTAPAVSNNVFLTADSASNFTSQTLDGSYTINALSFTGTSTSAASTPITLGSGGGGGTLKLTAGNAFHDSASNSYGPGTGLLVQAGSAGGNITAPIILGNSQTWEIDNSPTAPLTVSGGISDNSAILSLTKTGAGKLILGGTNTYSGGTLVSAGIAQLGSTTGLPTVGTLTVKGTGTFDLNGNSAAIPGLDDGGVSTGTLTSSTGSPTLTINNSSLNTFSGTISGSLGLTYTGTSSLTLGGTSSYTGLTTASSGTLNVAGNSSLGSATAATAGLLMNPTTAAVVNFTSASPTIASLNNSGGTSSIVLGNASGLGSATTLTIGTASPSSFSGVISDLTTTISSAIGGLATSGSGTLTLNAANTYTGNTTIGGASTLVLGNAAALQDSSLNLTSPTGALSFGTLTTATIGALKGNQNLVLQNTLSGAVALNVGGTNISSTYTGVLSGTGSLTKNGTPGSAGTFIIGSGAVGGASYTGNTTINEGTVQFGGVTHINSAGNITLSPNDAATNMVVADSAQITTTGAFAFANVLGSNQTPNNAALTIQNNGQLTVQSFSVGNGSGRIGGTTTVAVQDSAIFTVNGAYNLCNENPGTSATCDPILNLNGGILAVVNFIQSTATATHQATVHFNGGTLTALANDPSGSFFFPAPAAAVGQILDVDAGGLPVNTNGFSITMAGSLLAGTTNVSTGTDGGLTKSGSGKLTLTGANTYTGPTTINLGTLQFGQEVSLYNNVQTNWTPTNIIVNSGTTAAFNVGGSGEFFDSDIATLLGMASTATTGFENNSTLGLDTTNAFGTYDFNSAITNSNGNVINVTKLGPNTLTLHGANTYTGITTISAGTLQFANENTLYSNNHASWTAANLIVNSGATAAFNVDTTGGPSGTGLFTAADIQALASLGTASGGFKSGSSIGFDTSNDSTGNFTYSSAIANPNSGANVLGVAKLGFNTLTLPSANTYTGLTTVFNGTLVASNNSSLGSFTATTAGLVMNTTVGSPVVIFTASAPAIASLASNGPGSSSVVLGNSTAGSPTTLTVGANNTSTGYSGQITDGTGTNPAAIGSLIKTGTGTLTLTGQSNYTGKTTISQGTLALGNTNAISSTSQVILAGGTLATGGFGQDFTTAPLPATPATLKVTANSVLDFGTPPSFQQIKFAKSNGTTVPSASWTPGAILRINNWTGTPVIGGGGDTDQLLVGSDATGLDPTTQLQDIHFTGYLTGAVVLDVGSNNPGEVVPASATQLLRGDVTQNLHVDAGDIVALENALANLSQYEVAHSFDNLDALDVLDVNKDGSINNADVQALINLLVAGGGGNASVPEPSSLILLGLAGLVFLGRSYRQGTFQGAGAQRTS